MLRHVFAQYERQLHARPLTTKASAAGARRIYCVRLLHGRRACSAGGDLSADLWRWRCANSWWRPTKSSYKAPRHLHGLGRCHGRAGVAYLVLAPPPQLSRADKGWHREALAVGPIPFRYIFIPSFRASPARADDPIRQVQAQWSDALVVNWRLWIPAQLVTLPSSSRTFKSCLPTGWLCCGTPTCRGRLTNK